MKKIYALLFSLLFIASAGFAQIEFDEEILPKYPTAAELQYMEAKALEFKEKLKTRRPISDQMKNVDSCVGNCGGQAPGGCYCDNLCQQYGDCCSDYVAVCLAPPAPLPGDMVVPGEFEESQAVLIRWTYSTSASWRRMYAELIDAIQQEVPVWILINTGTDSNSVKSAILPYGVTLTNHEFLIKSTNSIWSRDYGPWGFYYTDQDELGFVDMQYYTSRPLDNQVPAFIANKMGVPYWTSQIAHEGGNLFVDGFGHAYHSTSLFQNNLSRNGWSTAFTRQTHADLFNTSEATEALRLNCDGGTGHIDMYAKLLDEETMIASEYPAVVTASDRQIIEDNVTLFESVSSTFGTPLKINRLPMPLRDAGTYSTTCAQINADARGFVNGLTINKTFIVPIYSNSSSPALNRNWDKAALDQIRAIMPGYNVIGIDSRVITPSGGALHCITMQIPSSNPIRYWHPKVEGLQAANATYPLISKISNKSGIASATCFWKKKGTPGPWNSIALSDSAGYYVGAIPNLSFTTNDTIIYYLNATSNNGKNLSKPIVAPEGYYTFYFDEDYIVPGNCAIPGGLSTTNITGISAKFNWASVVNVSSYTIRRKVATAANFATIEINNPSATSYTAPNLNPNTNYVWQIRANCLNQGGIVSEWSPLQAFTTGCAAPQNLAANNVGATSVNITWSASSSATGYRLRGRVVGGPWQVYEFNQNVTGLNSGNILTPGTNYEIQVRAYCNQAKTILTPWSASTFFTTAGSGISEGIWGVDASVLQSKVYPNPNQGQFSAVVYGASENFKLSIHDITGREIYAKQYPAGMAGTPIDIELYNAAKGIYFLHIISGEAQHIEKLIVR